MRISLIGYGKMGKEIEKIILAKGHTVPVIADIKSGVPASAINADNSDAVIEFTQPEAAFENITACINNGVPVVCGTTGWLERLPEVKALVQEKNGAFFYASNYSVGVNLFFYFNKIMAGMINKYPEYEVDMEEIHHTEKKDAPSGTAITAAETIMSELKRKNSWVNEPTAEAEKLYIKSLREHNVPGTHTVFYRSAVDDIEIKHTAHSRLGFASGAVAAAEFIAGKKGIYGMKDLLGIEL